MKLERNLGIFQVWEEEDEAEEEREKRVCVCVLGGVIVLLSAP